jgi:galactokinase
MKLQSVSEYRNRIQEEDFRQQLLELYPDAENPGKRITGLLKSFAADEGILISSPGRTELGGNHTDHNGGNVLAAAVNLDNLCFAAPVSGDQVYFQSTGYPKPMFTDLSRLEMRKEEKESTEALIRGIAAGFTSRGYKIGGFRAAVDSMVPPGSGLSSSASIELLIASLFNYFYNDDAVQPVELAQICQEAENNYFGKPCGLMDQLSIALGGVSAFNFKDPLNPEIQSTSSSFKERGYRLCIINTGGSHADLTPAYASIPQDMKAAADFFQINRLAELREEDFFSKLPELRAKIGDRAVMRTMHFLEETQRANHMYRALENQDVLSYFNLVRASGKSSFEKLQNIIAPDSHREQGLALGLALAESVLSESIVRVHGGGFAGTIQAYVPDAEFPAFKERMESVFHESAVVEISIRKQGVIRLI